MNEMIDRYDELGEIVFLIDYDRDGYYMLLRSEESREQVIRRSRSVVSLVDHVARRFSGDPKVEFSDMCEVLWSLESSDGREWWLEVLEEEND